MKKIVVGILAVLMVMTSVMCVEMSFASFPQFIASPVWSSNLVPEPEFLSVSDTFDSPDLNVFVIVGEVTDEGAWK